MASGVLPTMRDKPGDGGAGGIATTVGGTGAVAHPASASIAARVASRMGRDGLRATDTPQP